jgi:hypothetical protein
MSDWDDRASLDHPHAGTQAPMVAHPRPCDSQDKLQAFIPTRSRVVAYRAVQETSQHLVQTPRSVELPA